jgi:hypothetical protein
MGPVPEGFDLSVLVGRQLNQICIGPYDLQFRFDCDHIIACQGQVIVETDGASQQVFDGSNWSDISILTKIAGRDAVAWKVEASHEFSVSLTGGARLRFISTNCPYEEFVIHPEIWVV